MAQKQYSHKVNKSPAATYGVQLGARGRIVLPVAVRRQLNVKEGDKLFVVIEGDGFVRLTTLEDRIEECTGMLSHLQPGRSMVDDLIAERRKEASRE